MFGGVLKAIDLKALTLVLLTVVLGLVSALVLKEATLLKDLGWKQLFVVVCIAAGVNGLRFILWGIVHKNYPLSLSYPLSSLFFPCILFMGYFYGEDITSMKLLAVVMIGCGVGLLTYESQST